MCFFSSPIYILLSNDEVARPRPSPLAQPGASRLINGTKMGNRGPISLQPVPLLQKSLHIRKTAKRGLLPTSFQHLLICRLQGGPPSLCCSFVICLDGVGPVRFFPHRRIAAQELAACEQNSMRNCISSWTPVVGRMCLCGVIY